VLGLATAPVPSSLRRFVLRTHEERWLLALVVAAALVVRLHWNLAVHPPGEFVDSDMRGYVARAEGILDDPWGREEYSTFYPYGTHVLACAVQAQFRRGDHAAVGVVYAVLGALEVGFGYALARRVSRLAIVAPIRERVRPLVKAAKERVDVGIFYLTHKHLAGDLIDAHLRGVKVRVILDATAAVNGYTKHELLRAAGIPVKVENWGGKMHMKTAMIDGRTVITGSMNFTTAGEDGNDENVVIIHSEEIAAQYGEFFDARWSEIPDAGTSCTDGVDNDFDDLVDADDPGCSDDPPPLPKLPPHWIKPKDRLTCEW
jgi:phosphatidylserine/phosphatidylglycerophosphate/cardiolipin synthase-like enzyme